MSCNIKIAKTFIDECISGAGVGIDLFTYVKPCIFIYDQDAENGIIKIKDDSEIISTYSVDDVYSINVFITDSDDNIIYSESMIPFSTLSFTLPSCGTYYVQVSINYAVTYIVEGEEVLYVHQWASIYPVEYVVSGNYFNELLALLKCKMTTIKCEILKRKKVGRKYSELENDLYALSNYNYALCELVFCKDELESISCIIKKIKSC